MTPVTEAPTTRRPALTRDEIVAELSNGQSVAEAAEALGVHRVSLHRRMRQLGIRLGYEQRVVTESTT